MANPVIINIPIDTWVLVAANVVAGAVLPVDKDARYLYTIRDAGSTAPVNGVMTDAKELSYDGAIIQSSIYRDVYIAVAGDEPGKVRVDL